ncbi:Mettl22 [Symbiodinium natans]|uniref:Mettl22 protein n=1 Tax=Symbiodinium natans TaxID=878477 RepID=A0A812MTY1_9DINO|nr:Mettl22 [Symbiodinium natans]
MEPPSASDSDSEEGDICGIIEADGLALEELPPLSAGSKAWRLSALQVRAPQPPCQEDEDGDLVMPRAAAPEYAETGLVGWRIELERLATSQLEQVGLQLWAGALVLSDLLLTRPELVRGRTVCELGAGLGLCSLLAWRLGAHVLCTDGSAEAVANCQANLKRNGAGEVPVEVLRWEAPPTPKEGHAGDVWAAEVLLAADVIYDAAAAHSFAQLVASLLKTKATALYMSLEKRIYFSATTLKSEVSVYPQFLDDCALLGLEVEVIDLSEIPVHFKYLRSRFYELVAITAKAAPPKDTAD